MPLKEPNWWYSADAQHRARLLGPFAALYGQVAAHRFMFAQPYTSPIPVICIGNFTAGGTGKTPATIMLAEQLRLAGERPALLTRGYGGSIKGPHLVDPSADNALQTGDEALLLARCAPTVVSRDRAAGARLFEAMSDAPSVIVMDDGLQNPGLAKMFRIAVVDARRGVGNARVIPAGPLRAPLRAQLDLVDAILINTGPIASAIGTDIDAGSGSGEERTNAPADNLEQFFRQMRFSGPILRGGIVSRSNLEQLRGKPVLAFAGIGHPERFFETLRLADIRLTEAIPFKDHHFFDAGDAERLLLRADTLGAELVTTEKDHVRLLSYDDHRGELATRSIPYRIAMTLPEDDLDHLNGLVRRAISSADLLADGLMGAKD